MHTVCPSCGRANTFYITAHNGLGYCFACAYWEREDGYVPQEKKRGPIGEIRQYYDMLSKYYHSCLNKEHIQYLHKRGITDNLIEEYRIGYCPDTEGFFYNECVATEAGVVNKDKKPTLAGRIIFPYIYKGKVYDLRGRALDPNEETRYKGPHGTRYYRGADYPYLSDDMYYPHILVEGEIKALVCKSIGLRAVGIPGITILYEEYKPTNYYICYDSEAEQEKQQNVNKAIMKAARFGINPYVMTLPLMNKDKMGADDYILAAGKEAFIFYKNHALLYDVWRNMIGD